MECFCRELILFVWIGLIDNYYYLEMYISVWLLQFLLGKFMDVNIIILSIEVYICCIFKYFFLYYF